MNNLEYKKCPFCGKQEKIRFLNFTCSNPKCRSHLFVEGNRVIYNDRDELGVGTIKKIIQVAKKSYQKNKKIKHGNRFEKYLVEFNAYIEKIVYSNEIFHHIWKIDTKIRFNNGIGTIIKQNLVDRSGLIYYKIITEKGHTKEKKISETEIIDEIESPLEEFFKGNLDSQDQFLLKIWANQIKDLYSGNLLKIVTNSRLSLLPHQISVSHYLLQQDQARYILADEVGLGKTIEAGIYIKEMIARNLASRVLIIVPASLISQWKFEMNNKFNMIFNKLSSKVVKNIEINYQSGCFYDKKRGKNIKLCIVSLQYARLPQCTPILNSIEWDIVIFDEAHHLRRYLANQKTERYRTTLAYDLAEKLSEKTKNLLLLTATPIQLHSFDLFSLIQLLNRYEFPNFDSFEVERKKIPLLNVTVKNLQNFKKINSYERKALVFQILSFNIGISEEELEKRLKIATKRKQLIKKLETEHFLSSYVIRNRSRIVFPERKYKRIPKIIDVKLTDYEFDIYNKIHLYLAKIYSQNFLSGPTGMGFVMVILQKLLTSSVPAVLKSLKKRIIYLEDNEEMLLKLGMESEAEREFQAQDSSMDLAYGLEDYDLEDRLVYHSRKRKMTKKKKISILNIKDHIKILKEFVTDLEDLDFDSKANRLLEIIKKIFKKKPHEKIIIFTQFKATLFYLSQLLSSEGIKIAEFHGDLTEKQKKQSILNFKRNFSVLLSTEIGGEGRNFQFCHIIFNYDLPWNPMRLEQRIGRLDRIGQTHDVLIFNFYIQDTIESKIVTAISERIHLFEESIGALEPILGTVEGEITDLVLKEDEHPINFRLEEVISKTSNNIDTIYNKLDDFILDKRSFQFDLVLDEIKRVEMLTGEDIYEFFKLFSQYSNKNQHFQKKLRDVNFKISPIKKKHEIGLWELNFTEQLKKRLLLPEQKYIGVFDIDLARSQEEVDFFALGHKAVMNLADWCRNDDFGGQASIIYLDCKKLNSCILTSHKYRVSDEEVPVFKKILNNDVGLNLFIFEINFLGIIIEKTIVPIFITDDLETIPTLSNFVQKPYNFSRIIKNSKETPYKELCLDENITRKSLEKLYTIAKQSTKRFINQRANELIQLNMERYKTTHKKIIKTAKYKKKYVGKQLENAKLNLRVKKLKLPTERQIKNAEKIESTKRKKHRLERFAQRKKEVKYYKEEISRWEKILENMEFDIPAQIKRLKKNKKLKINANFISFARVLIN